MFDNITLKLEAYLKGTDLLKERLMKVPSELVRFKPSPEKWSIHEIVVHLADSEVQGYLRFRTTIAESGNTVMNCEEDKWARELNYLDQDLNDSLALIHLTRKTTYALLKNLPEEKWDRHVIHSHCGKVTLLEMLDTYTNHIPQHLTQMDRNEALWKKFSE